MSNEAEVYFALVGDFDPHSLSLGIAPTSTKLKAAPIPKHSRWIYSTGKVRSEIIDVYEMASKVVGALEPHTERIKEAKDRLGLEAVLEVVLTISQKAEVSTPAIGFEPSVISFLEKVGASIDVDTYLSER